MPNPSNAREAERRQTLRRTLAGLVPQENEKEIGPRALSARAAKRQQQLAPEKEVPSDPRRFPSPVAEVGRINDARLANVHRAPARGGHLVHAHRSNLSLAPPRSWEQVLMAQVDAAATAMRKTRLAQDAASSPPRQAWAEEHDENDGSSRPPPPPPPAKAVATAPAVATAQEAYDKALEALRMAEEAKDAAEAGRADADASTDADADCGPWPCADACWGMGNTAVLKAAAEAGAGGGAAAPVPRPMRELQQLGAMHLEEVQRAVRRQRARELYEARRWWYKPVARRGNKFYSLAGGGEPIEFVLGKRMLCEHSRGPRKQGFLVYDCAARALLEALSAKASNPLREGGRKLGCGNIAVLRVRATRPCAPDDEQWPTRRGVWAFGVLHPVAVAIEKQQWMAYDKCCDRWLPTTTPGLCRSCALGDKCCVQLRNAAPVGEPPAHPGVARAARAKAAHERHSEGASAAAPKSLDYACYA